MSDEEVTNNTQQIIGKFPNTYTFTKNLAEQMFERSRGNTPAVIYRPSIITGSAKEPMQGWTDSFAAAG